MTTPTSRDAARALWAKTGLTCADLSDRDLRDMRRCINDAMIKSGAIRGTLRCRQRFSRKTNLQDRPVLDLRCHGFYFDSRQAITLEDEFVGFAGWADDQNVQPILEGFATWLEARTARAAA